MTRPLNVLAMQLLQDRHRLVEELAASATGDFRVVLHHLRHLRRDVEAAVRWDADGARNLYPGRLEEWRKDLGSGDVGDTVVRGIDDVDRLERDLLGEPGAP